MANDGSGTGWDETSPAEASAVSLGAQETRDLRLGVRLRMKKEHDDLAGSTAGGEHKAGSAKVYAQSSAPTLRPDGVTALTAADNGRVWINSTDGRVYFYVHPDWTSITAAYLLANTVETADIQAGAVTNAKLATNAVGTTNIIDDAVTAAKIADGAIDAAAKLVDSVVTTAKIADANVTLGKLEAAIVSLLAVRIKSGSFAGSNTTNVTVNLDQVPVFVIVVNTTDGSIRVCFGSSAFNTAAAGASQAGFSTSGNSFTLTANTNVNKAANNFTYIAFCSNF